MNDDPIAELSQHLHDAHEADTEAAWRRYHRWVWAFVVVGALTTGAFVACLVAVWFGLVFVPLAMLTMWTQTKVEAARQAWRVLFQWGEDA